DEPEAIMGIRHQTLTVEGVQFHPESIASQQGHELLRNFLAVQGGQWS
ncbi:MAG: anthranilate/aminodeoxychorismate synthase component II, partial [Litoricolaceae bacterium]|nr:anthranilate/aminodeoxychorismate synthase component II [Litorivicinaceae bacterium]